MPRGLGSGSRAVCFCGSQPARHPPPFPQCLWIEQTVWKAETFVLKAQSQTPPELEGPQVSSALSLSIKQVHCILHEAVHRGKKATGKVGRALLTSTWLLSRGRAPPSHRNPCGIRRNKPLELRASCPLARYPCAAHNRSKLYGTILPHQGKPPPRALGKKETGKVQLWLSLHFWTTFEDQSSVQIPVPSLICSVTWISLFNLFIP